MPGFLLHVGATVLCAHGGQAQPTTPSPRVTVGGQPVVTVAASYTIAGCPFSVSGLPIPCMAANWIVAATRVMAGGAPLLLQDSQAVCIPNGTPLVIVATQVRVRGM